MQAETKRIYSILYIERRRIARRMKAGELVKAGAIGSVIQTIGLAPHRMNPATRPPWFFERARYGGILCDLASHQFDQFLFFTGSTRADIVAAQVGNVHHPQYPGLEDFGDVMLRGDGGTGYIRADWFTPDGLDAWGDGRTDDSRHRGLHRDPEERRHRRPRGRQPPVPRRPEGAQYVDCSDVALPYGARLVDDVLNRTQTADDRRARSWRWSSRSAPSATRSASLHFADEQILEAHLPFASGVELEPMIPSVNLGFGSV